MRAQHCGFLVVAFAAFLAASASPKAQIPAPPQDEIETAPVEVDGVLLFRVRGVTSFPAGARAQLIRDRLPSRVQGGRQDSDRRIDWRSD